MDQIFHCVLAFRAIFMHENSVPAMPGGTSRESMIELLANSEPSLDLDFPWSSKPHMATCVRQHKTSFPIIRTE